ncbi:hypothetical protein [Brevibacillus sp. NRS-1366]|uniref:hypothetical protein n=1 Tax=Brevibacillus sp. NRS-1366 TaxID=3233899 RepID=UPI003D21EAC4
MSDAFQIGPFILKTSTLAAIISLAIGFLMITIRLKNEREARKAIIEMLGNAVLLAFLIWKLSFVLLHFSKAIENPATILYFSGGVIGAWLAGVAVAVYLTKSVKKKGIPIHLVVLAIATGFLAAQGIHHLLTIAMDNTGIWLHVQQVAISAVFMWWLFHTKQGLTSIPDWLSLVLWFAISQIYVLFFIEAREVWVLGLSQEQVAYYLLSLLLLFLSTRVQTQEVGGSANET